MDKQMAVQKVPLDLVLAGVREKLRHPLAYADRVEFSFGDLGVVITRDNSGNLLCRMTGDEHGYRYVFPEHVVGDYACEIARKLRGEEV